MKYINLTPRWTEILTVWQRIVERSTSAKRGHRIDYNANMGRFWNEMKRMAQGADNYNDLVTQLRVERGYSDEKLEVAIIRGREINERERNTIKESDDVLS